MGIASRACIGCLLVIFPLIDAKSAPQAGAASAAYEDKLIRSDAIWDDPDAEAGEPYDMSGPARSMYLEGVRSILNHNGDSYQEDGLLFGFRRETENYGAFSLEGALREGGHSVITGWQRNIAFEGDWRANNGLGMLNTPSTELTRRQYRFFIPTMTMAGGVTEWSKKDGSGTTFLAGIGQPGIYTGIRVPAFYGLPGTVFSAGAQTSLSSSMEAGLQIVGANGVNLNPNPFTNTRGPELSTTGALASVAWNGGDARVQANFIGVESNLNGTRGGGWVDAWLRGETLDHYAGIFRLEPGLLWGNQQIVTDIQGVYYRTNYQSRQWQWDGGVDYSNPVSGSYRGSVFLTGNGRYQYSRDWGFGGGTNIRQGLSDAWSTFAFVDNQNRLGVTRFQMNYAQDPTRQGTQLTLDQTWNLQQSTRLGTALSLLHENGDTGSFNNIGLSVYGGGVVGNNLTLDGSVQWNSQAGSVQGPSTYVNVALNWRFLPGWMASIFAYQNNATVWRPLVVDSPIANPDLSEQQKWNDSGVFLSLRYEFSAGRSYAPLGGAVGDGAGNVTGIIYFDQNDDGRLSSGEQGIPNLTVLLNGKFVTRTDASGRFEFSQVRAGNHVVTVLPDNLPLPWRLRNEGRKEISVDVRGTTTLEIGAARMR